MGRRATYNRTVEEPQNESLFDENDELMKPVEMKRDFKDDDMIPCVSVTVGLLLMQGQKTKDLYHWADMGSIQEVAYKDLVDEVRNNSAFVFEPRFIIQDDDFLAKYKAIADKYGELYTPQDIDYVLTLTPVALKDALSKMPLGTQEAVKNRAMKKINSGELDSVQRVRALDEYFGTDMMIKLVR